MMQSNLIQRIQSRRLVPILPLLLALLLATPLQAADKSGNLQQADVPRVQQEATPLEVQILSPTPPPVIAATPTPTYTPSPEVQSAAMLEVKADAGEINVRAEADIEAEILGQIRNGTQYVITGRYFRWYQFRFDLSPNGRGWVFEELIEIQGDPALIPDLSALPQATTNPTDAEATRLANDLLLTPGAVLTATANSRELVGPVAVTGGNTTDSTGATVEAVPRTVLPTFTFPPDMDRQLTAIAEADPYATPEPAGGSDEAQFFPPLVQIALLGIFGSVGLMVAAARR